VAVVSFIIGGNHQPAASHTCTMYVLCKKHDII